MPEYTVESTRAYLPTSVPNVTLVDSPEPVPTASTAVVRGRALYDTPSPGVQPDTLRRSDRTRTATKRAQAGYLQSRAKSKERSEKIKRARAFSQSQASQNATQADREPTDEATNPEAEREDHNRATSKSPTPIPTATEQEAQPRLDRKQVQRDLTRRFWSTLADQSTQTLVEVLDDISNHPAHAIRPEAPDPEVFMLSPVPVGGGGGFHLDHPARGSNKRRPDSATSKIRKSQFKLPPPNQQLDCDDNTDTNTETETEIEDDPQPIPAPRLAPRLPSNPVADPDSPFLDQNGPFLRYPSTRSSLPVDQAPQNASTDGDRDTTAANPDVPPSPAPSVPTSSQLRTERSLSHISTSSKSLGGPIPPSLPNHSWVRAERSLTYISASSRSLGDPIPTPALGQGQPRHPASQTRASQNSDNAATQRQGSEPATRAPSPAPEPPSTVMPKGTPARSRAGGFFLDMASINAQRAPSQTSGAGPSRRSREPTRNSAPWPSSSTRANRSRSRSIASTHWPSAAPTPRRQAQHSQPRVPRLRPSQSPVPSPTRSNTPPDLLPGDDGDEEGPSDYEAAAKATRSAAQGRKPSMLDLEGNEHFIVLKVKDVLWAFAIHEGSFQIRSVYCIWFEGIYQQVWIKELPGITYRKPSDDACTVAVNSIPSRRGHVKERLRSIIKAFFKFVHPKDDTERAQNVETYDLVMPNRFHLLKPKENIGYYESEVIDESIAGAFFYSPTAIGVQFPNYFEKMENSVVAFVLSMIQFCISEWEGGSFTKKKLDANHMLALYVCHYEGLKVADSVEDGPMPELRERWYKGSLAASQASSTAKNFVQPITRAEDIRRGQTRRQPQGIS